MVELFTTGPARVLGMDRKIAPGQPADLTIFLDDHAWTYKVKNPKQVRNSPLTAARSKAEPCLRLWRGK